MTTCRCCVEVLIDIHALTLLGPNSPQLPNYIVHVGMFEGFYVYVYSLDLVMLSRFYHSLHSVTKHSELASGAMAEATDPSEKDGRTEDARSLASDGEHQRLIGASQVVETTEVETGDTSKPMPAAPSTEAGPPGVQMATGGLLLEGQTLPWKLGDWKCSKCGEHLFAKKDWCRYCKAP